MLKKMSIRLRITFLTTLILIICCIGLTFVLNFNTYNLVDRIDATLVLPTLPTTDVTVDSDKSETESVTNYPSQSLQNAKIVFSVESIVYMLIIIIGGGTLTYYISGNALKPLKNLNKEIKNINVNNLSNKLLVPDTKDEILELTNSFNDMKDKLNESFLMEQRFSANVSHELRTPLCILQTKIDVFNKKQTHTTKEYENIILLFGKQITRLRKLVVDILDMTTDTQNIQEYGKINLKKFFTDVINDLSELAQKEDINVSLYCDSFDIKGDIDSLYRAFYNLIENGIKYNKPNGSVDIYVKQLPNNIEILIKDTGIGIGDEMKKHIFEPFFRVDKSRSRSIGGAGLGLSLVENIIKKHGGEIKVLDNDNLGTCFKIILNEIKAI